MNHDSDIRHFADMSSLEKSRLLAHFMYEMTLEARNFYAAGGDQPMDPHKLRFINEVQHRVTRFIEQILIDDPARPSDEVLLRLLLAPRAEKAIEGLVHSAYTRTIQAIS
jgi:hypothetical protein